MWSVIDAWADRLPPGARRLFLAAGCILVVVADAAVIIHGQGDAWAASGWRGPDGEEWLGGAGGDLAEALRAADAMIAYAMAEVA